MAQVTIYLNDELESKMRQAAKAMDLSQSKWIARLIQAQLQNEWPQTVVALAGAWQDLPEAEEIRQGMGIDNLREAL